MKKLLFLLLFTSLITSAQQTTYSDAEIRAVAGNRWEHLIVGTEDGYIKTQYLLDRMGFKPENGIIQFGKTKWIHSNQTNGKVIIQEKMNYELVKKGEITHTITTSLDIYGDKLSIIKFYINFWSKALNFRDVKEGETVSVRFLSDVATLTVNKDNTAIIKVRSAKER